MVGRPMRPGAIPGAPASPLPARATANLAAETFRVYRPRVVSRHRCHQVRFLGGSTMDQVAEVVELSPCRHGAEAELCPGLTPGSDGAGWKR